MPLAVKIADEGFRVLLHDRRNTGASQMVIEGGLCEEEIRTGDIAALIEHLGIGPVFVGVASSGARGKRSDTQPLFADSVSRWPGPARSIEREPG